MAGRLLGCPVCQGKGPVCLMTVVCWLGGGWGDAVMEWHVGSSSSAASSSGVMPMGGTGVSEGGERWCWYALFLVERLGEWAYSGGRRGVAMVRWFVASSSPSSAAWEEMVGGIAGWFRGGRWGRQSRQTLGGSLLGSVLGRVAAVSLASAAAASVQMGPAEPSVPWYGGSVDGGRQVLAWVHRSRWWVDFVEVVGVRLVGAVVSEGVSSSSLASASAAQRRRLRGAVR